MIKRAALETIQDSRLCIAKLEQAIVSRVADSRAIEILEAGCGRQWDLRLGGLPYRLTGIDLDREALDYRLHVVKDLHEGILGNLSDHDFRDRQFDVVYSAFVLEHIEHADKVMRQFARWLRPGGLLILAIPDPDSAYGFVTRMTPHWFHVQYYRRLYGFKDAGKPGFGPYKTHYDRLVSRDGIHEFCARNDLAIFAEYGTRNGPPRQAWRKTVIRVATGAIALLSFGRLASKHDNLLYIIQKGVRATRNQGSAQSPENNAS